MVRLMRLTRDRAVRRDGVDGMPAPAVPSAVGEIGVQLQIIPARRKHVPIRQRADRLERGPHLRRMHEGIAHRLQRSTRNIVQREGGHGVPADCTSVVSTSAGHFTIAPLYLTSRSKSEYSSNCAEAIAVVSGHVPTSETLAHTSVPGRPRTNPCS